MKEAPELTAADRPNAPAARRRSIAVVGGGVTGLTAAWSLARSGQAVRLFEGSSRLGGSVRSTREADWLIEAGPASIQDNSPEVRELIRELGLAADRVEAQPEAVHRYLARGDRLEPLPASPPALLRSRLFSPGAKLRVLRELFARPRERASDVSLAAFMTDHFGSEVVARAVQPGVSGIYAGDVERLSTRYGFPRLWEMEHRSGSLLRAQMQTARGRRARGEPATPRIFSFRDGLQTLTDALAAQLPPGSVTLGATVASLRPAAGSRWTVEWQSGAETFDAVVLALPAWALAEVAFGEAGGRPLAALAGVVHPPVASVFLGYRRDQVAHPLDGFGVLIPATAGRCVLGALFSSTLFPGRAPSGHVALTALTGGALRPALARRSAAELVAAATGDLHELLGITGRPEFVRTTVWPRAIPQYDLGYDRMLEAMAGCEAAHPGILIGGAARDGISLPQCIQAGLALARKAACRP